MTIENSVLTYIIFIIAAVISCVKSYKKRKNTVRTIIVFLWAAAIYFVFSCCILPIQLTPVFSGSMESFKSQFVYTSADYFWKYFLEQLALFFSFFAFSFFACGLFMKQRQVKYSLLLLLGLMFIHLLYNTVLNTLLGEIVKYINAEDFIIMALGYMAGWACARGILKLCPEFGNLILEDKSGEN